MRTSYTLATRCIHATDVRACHTACSFHSTRCPMATCDVCGNNYDKSFTLQQGGRSGTFDSFECAIHAFAPAAHTANARSLGMALKEMARSSAVHCAGHGVQDTTGPELPSAPPPASCQRQAKAARSGLHRISQQRQCAPFRDGSPPRPPMPARRRTLWRWHPARWPERTNRPSCHSGTGGARLASRIGKGLARNAESAWA